MPREIVMPQLGLTMTEGSLTTWLKKLGERVEKGEPLFTVETDKVEMEVESTASGYLNSIQVEPGQKVPVGTVIALLTEKAQPEQAERAAVAYSPRARRLAKELGINIEEVKPSRGHRVVEDDVRKLHASIRLPVETPEKPTAVIPARKVIAERMTASFEKAPHFYLGVEVNASELVRLRRHLIGIVQQRVGVKLTYTDFLLKALANALADHRNVNAFWQDGGVVRRGSVDVGFAVDASGSLLAPVIRQADKLSLPEMAKQRLVLTEKAREQRLALVELEGGSATLSNLGQLGIDWFQAILNPPQSIILAAGQIARRPMVVDDRIEPCDSLILTLSADHRVIDGAAAARFLSTIKASLENPYGFLL